MVVLTLVAQHGGWQRGVPLNKLGAHHAAHDVISKERRDGSVKHRLIRDSRRSGVNGEQDPAQVAAQRIVMPRLCDFVEDFIRVAT
eukprot:4095125-Amphidinium_carterae.1